MDDPHTEHAAQIVKLGDPRLRRIAVPVTSVSDPRFVADARTLQATLARFRSEHGFGRAMAAPQIGVASRFVAVELGDRPRLLVNPKITWESGERFTMWDDCMSFPDLLVRVERARSISVEFQDERGEAREWTRLDTPTAELLQHEIDHLDGVLAVDRAIDREAIVLRDVFDADRDYFLARVDYVIPVAAYGRGAGDEG